MLQKTLQACGPLSKSLQACRKFAGYYTENSASLRATTKSSASLPQVCGLLYRKLCKLAGHYQNLCKLAASLWVTIQKTLQACGPLPKSLQACRKFAGYYTENSASLRATTKISASLPQVCGLLYRKLRKLAGHYQNLCKLAASLRVTIQKTLQACGPLPKSLQACRKFAGYYTENSASLRATTKISASLPQVCGLLYRKLCKLAGHYQILCKPATSLRVATENSASLQAIRESMCCCSLRATDSLITNVLSLTFKLPEKLQLYGLYVYYVVHICDFGMLRVKRCIAQNNESSHNQCVNTNLMIKSYFL